MKNSLTIQVPHIVEVAQAAIRNWNLRVMRQDPAEQSLGKIPELIGFFSSKEEKFLIRRETSENPTTVLNELRFMVELWTALRFDAIGYSWMDLDDPNTRTVAHCAITECVRDCNTVFNHAFHQGRTFFTKVLPGLGKAIDSSLLDTSDGMEAFSGVPFTAKAINDLRELVPLSGMQDDSKDFRVPVFLQSLFHDLYGIGGVFVTRSFNNEFIAEYNDFNQGPLADWVNSGADTRPAKVVKVGDPEPNRAINALKHLRQLCFLFYKLEVPFEKESVDRLLTEFCTVDSSLPIAYATEKKINFFAEKSAQYTRFIERFLQKNPEKTEIGACVSLNSHATELAAVARSIVCRVLGTANPREIRGKHGPGAVATGERAHQKACFSRIYTKLEMVFPFGEYFRYNNTHMLDTYDSIQTTMTLKESATAKVVLVPKDSRGPRLISCEPLEIQWIQQGLNRLMVETIESHAWTKGLVCFTDQNVNRARALQGSSDGSLGTIDMKEASDRVSVALIELLFPQPWVEALLSARSDETRLPNGKTVELRKFAPMGSATCFPVEALCFFALSAAGVYCRQMAYRNLPPITGKKVTEVATLRKVCRTISVYGDDIIAPTDSCGSAIAALETFSLVVNKSKCFLSGFFRESCGMDAFHGVPVSPTRIKRVWDGQSLPRPDALLSYTTLSNALYEQKYLWASWVVEGAIQRAVKHAGKDPIPYTTSPNPKGVRFIRDYAGSFWPPVREKKRWNHKTHQLECREITVVPSRKRGSNQGWDELLRCESLRTDHLQYGINPNCWRADEYAVPRSYKLQMRWMPCQ